MAVMSDHLVNPGQKYESYSQAIKAEANGYLPVLDSAWLIGSSSTVQQVTDRLRAAALDDNDEILVIDVTRDARAGWLNKAKWEWISTDWPA